MQTRKANNLKMNQLEKIKLQLILPLLSLIIHMSCSSQMATVQGRIITGKGNVEFAKVFIKGTQIGANSDSAGNYTLNKVPYGG